jgi:tetratricopeptide (TPR) repeat protein
MGLFLFTLILNSKTINFLKDKFRSPFFSWISEKKYWGYVILSLLFLLIFWLLRTRTHLLGDGYLRAQEIISGTGLKFTEFLDLYLHGVLYDLFHQIINWDAFTVYALVSCVCGAVFVFFVLLLGDGVGKRGIDKVLIFFLLVLSGGSQLFSGYVESYTISYLGVLLFFYFSIGYLEGRIGLALPFIFLILSILFHASALYLFPAFALLLLTKRKDLKPDDSKKVGYGKFLIIILITLVAISGFYVLRYYPVWEPVGKLSSFLIPLTSTVESPYSLFSLSHLLDVINVQLLITPVGIVIWVAMLLCMRKRLNFRSPTSQFFLMATIFAFGFALLIDPVLGYARDWDLFASTGLGYTIWGGYLLVSVLKESKKAKQVYYTTAITILICCMPWFFINADKGRSVRRFENIIELYQRGKAYGHETLSIFYKKQGMIQKEMEELEKAMALEKNPRYLSKLGAHYLKMGELDRAMLLLRNAIQIDPDDPEVHNNLGVAYTNKGLLDGAILEFKKAIELRPSYSSYYKNLGFALYQKGFIDEAIKQYNVAIILNPENPSMHYWLGVCYAEKGLLREAIRSLEKSLELRPDFVDAYYTLGTLLSNTDKKDEAIHFLKKATQLKPDFALAHYALALVLTEKNLNQEAIRHLQIYLDLSKDTAESQKVRNLLEKLKSGEQK